jgi:signal transduction histidine kinase
MQTGLENKAQTAAEFFSHYQTESEYRERAADYVANFGETDTLELEFIDTDGQVILSSYAYQQTSGVVPGTKDIANALTTGALSTWTGKDSETGERIMAVSAPVVNEGAVRGVIRMVTSMRVVDRQLILWTALLLAVAAAILLMIYSTNLYFVKSIAEPIADITETTKRIAAGSYGVQLEKKYNDEIGELVDTINDMSLKVSQAEKMKSEFISSVSHELRTPLTAINGWGETLLRGEVTDPRDVQKGMAIIVSEAKRLTKMVEELLEFSRIEDGRFTLRIELIDIKAELEDAVYTYREFFRKKGISLEYYECEEDFPPIPGDPERLRQVFSNLLDNAAKHGGSGKRITVSIFPEGTMVAIRIRDYGHGIPPEELPHVKTKFYKGSSKARGSGIGLAVCDEIAIRHNGSLTIENAQGGGCAVTLRLPIHEKN